MADAQPDIDVRLGDSVDLPCPTEGGEDITRLTFCNAVDCTQDTELFQWSYDQPLPTGGKYSLDVNAKKVTIHDVQISDERTYNCRTSDPFTQDNRYNLVVYGTRNLM